MRNGSNVINPNTIYILSKHFRANNNGLNDLIIASGGNTDLNDLIQPEAERLEYAESFVKSFIRAEKLVRNEREKKNE